MRAVGFLEALGGGAGGAAARDGCPSLVGPCAARRRTPRRIALFLALLLGAMGCAGSRRTGPASSPGTRATGPSAPASSRGTGGAPAASVRPTFEVAQELVLARAARDEGRTRDAAIHFERVVRADPKAFEARVELAELLMQQSIDLGWARRLLDEAQAIRADDVRLDRTRGWLDELQGDDTAAVGDYARVLSASPDPELRLRRGILLIRLGRIDEALEELRRVAAERPGDRAARTALADIYEYQGRNAEAEAVLIELAQLAPTEPGPQRRLAAFYRRQGQSAKALEAEARARSLEAAPRSLRPLRPSGR